MSPFHVFKSIVPVGVAIGIAVTASTFGIQVSTELNGFSVAQTQGSNNRQDRRQDRQGDRDDRGDDRQDCRQEEGAAGNDKRDCKQDERQDRNSDSSSTSNDE